MGNRSRGRYRAERAAAAVPDPEQVAANDAVADAFETLETDKKGGLDKLVALVMGDRDKALAPVEPITMPARMSPPSPMRVPTSYEAAILWALGNRYTLIARSGPPMVVPIAVASGGMYGGTVEPERVAHRRRRNKAAHLARIGRPPRRVGKVYQSRFGYLAANYPSVSFLEGRGIA